LAADALCVNLCFELLVHDAFMRGVHIDQHQTLRILSQDVHAMQLCNGFTQGPSFGRSLMERGRR
jgi:hypothetical protein